MPKVLPGEITRTTLAVLLIGILIASCFWIMQPFLYAIVWAAMIVIATWPIHVSLQALLGGRRWAAALIMTFLVFCTLFVPLTAAVMMLVDNFQKYFISGNFSFGDIRIPVPPEWVHRIPLAGPKIVSVWKEYGSLDTSKLDEYISPYYEKILGWGVSQAESFGMVIVNSLLTIIIAGVLYTNGESAAEGVCRFVTRIAGEQGKNAVILAARAVRGVALGVVVSAIIQSIITYGLLSFAGVPAVLLLTAITFVMCIAQVGPIIVLIPVTIWIFYKGEAGWGVFMVVWTVTVTMIDNFTSSLLIRKGVDLPLMLVFAGVLGGLISFGILGIFIGPAMLAVTYTLIREWVSVGETGHQIKSGS
jgi:predicted PurR-regulated permease PerM